MKRKSVFSLISISFAMVLGAVGALRFGNKEEIKEAKAAVTAGDNLYLIPSSAWFEKYDSVSPRFAAYFFGTGNTWADPEETIGNAYKFVVPSGTWTNVIFCRMKGNQAINNWDNKLSQTGDLNPDVGKNCYAVDGGVWSTYSTYSYRINEASPVNFVVNNKNEVMSANNVNLSVGDMIYFQKDGVDLAVTPKEDGQLTKVISVDNDLKVVQNYTDKLYLDITTNKLWAGQYTYAAGNYLVGSFNGWQPKEAIALPAADATFAADDEVKAVSLTANQKTIADGNYIGISSLVSHPNGAVIVENDNAKIVTAGEYSVSVADGVYTFTKSDYVANYKLRIGSEDHAMTYHEENEWKLEHVNLSHGDVLGYKEDNVLVDDSFAKVVANNNLRANKTVLVDANDVTVYVDVVAKSIWVGGLPLGGYHLLINEHELVTLTQTSDFDGYKQYGRDGVSFDVDDTIEYIDCGVKSSLPVVFHNVELNAGGLGGNFEIVSTVLTCRTACTAEVYLKISNARNEIYLGAEREEVTLARNYATGFVSAMNTACKAASGYVGVVESEVKSAWGAQATAYAGLAAEVKTELQKGTLSTIPEVVTFAENYTGIYARRGASFELSEFMGWGVVGGSNTVNPVVENNNNTLLVVIIVSSASLLAIGGFLFVRKRKESK